MKHLWGALLLAALVTVSSPPGLAAERVRVSGYVIDASTGLRLAGAQVQTVGPTVASATTNTEGAFAINGLAPGVYALQTTLRGYEGSLSEEFILGTNDATGLALALQRLQGLRSDARVLGVTTIRGTATLQKASVIYKTVSAQALVQSGTFRVGDALRTMSAVNNSGGDTASPGDDIHIDIRGIGDLETVTLLDGHPIGPGFRGSFNYEVTPAFGLRDVNIVYGSGADFYGVNAIGGVVDLQTLEPTKLPSLTVSQTYGTFSKLGTVLQATGTVPDGSVGYALAFGTSGQNGYFRHDNFYQASAAYDPYATDPAVRQLGVYEDDTSITSKSVMGKLRYRSSPASHITLTALSSNYWDNKTGNGDNDYLPYEVVLASGQNQLSSAIASGTDSCNIANPNTFTVSTNISGSTPGIGPNGAPDGGSQCQTPQSFASANAGYQGAGPAWQSFQLNDYHARFDVSGPRTAFVTDVWTNTYAHTYDRTAQLPYLFVSPSQPYVPNAFWYNEQNTNFGVEATQNWSTVNNDLGVGFFWENSAYLSSVMANPQPAPVTHDTAYFIRAAVHPENSKLSAFVNTWFKHSTITNTSYMDPRVALVYSSGNNVLRVAGGRTSAQPFPTQIISPFTPTALGAFTGGNIKCSTPNSNSVGNVPSSQLKPERATDEELSFGHRFFADSSVQLSLYNESVFQKIYNNLTLPLSSLSAAFDPTPYANAVATVCGITPAQALPLLGVSGSINLGHTLARGVDISGRQRVSAAAYVDYSWSESSSILRSSDPALVDPSQGGQLFLIPNAQLPNVPLHKWQLALDYTFPRNIEARLSSYHVSEHNPKNLPGYTYENFQLAVPVGSRSTVTFNVNNIFNTDAFYEGRVGEGYPQALNHFATAGAYVPFFGANSTERFGLPFRTLDVTYQVRIK